MEISSPKERRRYVRYDTDLEGALQLDADTLPVRIKQISRGGCLVYPALDSNLSPHIALNFRLSPEIPPIQCKGEIIFSITVRGSGIAFMEISEHDQDMITQHHEKGIQAGAA